MSKAMKPQTPTSSPAGKGKLRFGLPGSAAQRGDRIKAAIKANRETLRRLAK
jgi:death on curing protein